MGPLIKRKFEKPGDVELGCGMPWICVPNVDTSSALQARDLVHRSSGVERTRELASAHAGKAHEVLAVLPDSDAKGALEALTERVVKRTH